MAFNLEENGGPLRKGVVKQDSATGREQVRRDRNVVETLV